MDWSGGLMPKKFEISTKYIPQINLFFNMSEVKLNSDENYVLSCIDGMTNIEELAKRYNIYLGSMLTTLEKLSNKGAVDFLRDQDLMDATAALYEEVVINPYDLSEDVELTRKEKKRVLALFQRLDRLNHYQLLDVVSDADREMIKKAYIAIYQRYVPKNWREKQLGTYHHKVDTIVRSLKEAYTILRSNSHRKRYDQKIGILKE